jgi:lipoprotein-releasing system permease protein
VNYAIILSIARTHLNSRKRQTIVASLGVTFGIAAYIIMMSFMTGLNGLLDGMILNRTPHIHIFNELSPSTLQPIDRSQEYRQHARIVRSVRPKKNISRIRNASALSREITALKDVRAVTPMVRAQGFYLGGSNRLSASLIGVDAVKEAKFYQLDDYVVQGSSKELQITQNGIILGKGVADKLSLKIGDKIQIGSPNGTIFQFKIVAFYQSGLADIDKVQSYINLKAAQRLMGESVNYITDLNVKLYDMTKATQLAKSLTRTHGINAVDIQTANAQFETGSSIRTLISYAVSITLLVVAGFGIYNILNMLIYEKMNDIAILKATGFSGRDVQQIFLSQAMIIGIIGGALGLIVGYFISWLISRAPFETEALPTIKTYPVNFDPVFYVIAVCFALVFTFLAGFLPSRKARKIDPVDIIRGQ